MKDLYLVFEDAAAAKAALKSAGFEFDDVGLPAMEGVVVDVVGVIYDINGSDTDNMIATPVPGWHVNLRVLENINLEPLQQFSVTPKTPTRVWA